MKKQLPIIGKMPLFKRPVKEAKPAEPEEGPKQELVQVKPKEPSITTTPIVAEVDTKETYPSSTSAGIEEPAGTVTGGSAVEYGSSYGSMQAVDESMGMGSSGYGYDTSAMYSYSAVTKHQEDLVSSSRVASSSGSGGASSGNNLPDDFQQALDIIYAGPEKAAPPAATAYQYPAPPPSSYGKISGLLVM